MTNNENNRATLFALLFLAAIIVGAPLVLILIAAWKAGAGFNRTTFVLICASIALIGAFVLWVKAGAGTAPPQRDPNACDLTQGSLWSRLVCRWRREWPYTCLAYGVGMLGVALGILYVEYIDPLFK